MKNLILLFLSLSILGLMSFNFESKPSADENWYICGNCCKSKKATSAPWESGCTSGQHNYQFSGKAGNYNHTCRNCNVEVFLTSSTSPNASKCCKSGGTHSWYHK